MRHKKMAMGLFAALTLASMSTASAQTTTTTTTTTTTPPPFSSSFQLTLSPTELQPDGTIQVLLKSGGALDGRCGGAATSPGFVAPIALPLMTHTTHAGSGQVIKKPGDYVATVPCTDGSVVTATFKIVGGHVPPPPTTPATPPKRVTPVGAPQTGGGGTAGS